MSLMFGKLAADAIPRHLTTLSLSWLNNQCKVVFVQRGRVVKTYEPPASFESQEKLDELIQNAVNETGYQGSGVSLVLAHPRLVQQIVEVPPVKGNALGKIIQRQVQQQKFFSGEAAYAVQMMTSTKTSRKVLLHLLPRPVLSQFMLACRRNGLDLVSVLPASAVLQRQAPALGLQKGDVAMLAAETGGATTAVICDGDGRLLMARTLQGNWNDDPTRLALDLNRTILFVTQQHNVTLNRGLYLFGAGAVEQSGELQRAIQLPVKACPVAYEPFYWASESLKIRAAGAPNFLTPELQKAPQRRVFARVVAAGVTLLLCGSIALTTYALMQSRWEREHIEEFKQQMVKLETREIQLSQLDAELERKSQAIRVIVGEKPPPLPSWLLAYLGQAVPPDLVVTNFNIKREPMVYRVRLAGTYQEAAATTPPAPENDPVEQLKGALTNSPFHLRLNETNTAAFATLAVDAKGNLVPGTLKDIVALASQKFVARKDAEAQGQLKQDRFVIEGVLR